MQKKPAISLTAAQCRAARALLDWSQDDLAARAEITRTPLAMFEGGKSTPYQSTLERLRKAIERGGVEILDDGEESRRGGPGVRLRGK